MDLTCSFCGKSAAEVAKLAAGPRGLHICDECVETCRLVMAGADLPEDPFDPQGWPTDRLLAALPALDATAVAYREHVARAVDALRARGISWARIAKPLGITRQSAWDRFS